MFSLHDLEFCLAETRSGTRNAVETGLLLSTTYASEGQSDRYAFSHAPKEKNELHVRNAAIVRIVPMSNSDLLVDFSDGSEWRVSKDSQSHCHLRVGSEALVLSIRGDPSVSVSASGERCPLKAIFVKGW
jgi:hypothetical protein